MNLSDRLTDRKLCFSSMAFFCGFAVRAYAKKKVLPSPPTSYLLLVLLKGEWNEYILRFFANPSALGMSLAVRYSLRVLITSFLRSIFFPENEIHTSSKVPRLATDVLSDKASCMRDEASLCLWKRRWLRRERGKRRWASCIRTCQREASSLSLSEIYPLQRAAA